MLHCSLFHGKTQHMPGYFDKEEGTLQQLLGGLQQNPEVLHPVQDQQSRHAQDDVWLLGVLHLTLYFDTNTVSNCSIHLNQVDKDVKSEYI